MLESNIFYCTLDAIKSVGHADLDKKNFMKVMIFHRHSGSGTGYSTYEFKFASQYVGDKVVDAISRRRYDEMKMFALG